MFIFPILLFFALIYRQVKKDLIISHEYHYFQPNTYHYKSKQDKLNLVQWVIQKSSNILDVFIISKISKNILTIQSKVFSHFTEKSVVRKHIKSVNQTDNEGEKSFLSALIVMHVFFTRRLIYRDQTCCWFEYFSQNQKEMQIWNNCQVLHLT